MNQVRPSRRVVAEPPPVVAEEQIAPRSGVGVIAALRSRWPLLGVLALYLLALLIIPVMTPVAIGDDWVYARSVEILLKEGRVHILDLSVVTLVSWLFGATVLSSVRAKASVGPVPTPPRRNAMTFCSLLPLPVKSRVSVLVKFAPNHFAGFRRVARERFCAASAMPKLLPNRVTNCLSAFENWRSSPLRALPTL